MLDIIGGLIGAGANLLGGMFGQQNQQQINQQNIAAQQAINQQNIAEQEKFAQQGIQWKVADAKAAGINPLAALGASTGSFSNVVAPQAQGSNSFGTGIAGAGQNISRAMQAMQSPQDQAVAAEKTRLDLESSQLDNDLKRASLASSLRVARQPGSPPGLSRPKGDDLQRDATLLWRDPGQSPALVPSAEAQRSMWGNPSEESAWWWRNVAPQMLGSGIPASLGSASPGRSLYLNPWSRTYYELPNVRKIKKGSRGLIDTTGEWNPFGF